MSAAHTHLCGCGVVRHCYHEPCQASHDCGACAFLREEWATDFFIQEQTMNIHDSFPSAYLKASDLGTAQPVVTIDRVEHEPVGREKEMKAILYFQGKEKGVVLNKTNSKKIVELIGSSETDDWAGFKIRLFATTTEFGGETVECIRVKAAGVPAKPKPERAPAPVRRSAPTAVAMEDAPEHMTELTDDEIPF